jgi:hypothetical protein
MAVHFYLIDDGETRWGLSDGRGLMDLRRMVALSGVMVTLMARLARSVH